MWWLMRFPVHHFSQSLDTFVAFVFLFGWWSVQGLFCPSRCSGFCSPVTRSPFLSLKLLLPGTVVAEVGWGGQFGWIGVMGTWWASYLYGMYSIVSEPLLFMVFDQL